MHEEHRQSDASLTPAQQVLHDLWEEHVRHEFVTRHTEDTLDTMVEDAYVNHIPVLTGGAGRQALREFYAKRFIPQMPADTAIIPVSRTIGTDQLVDEMIFTFTHTIPMDWMLPGIAPTGKRVEVPLVAIVKFRDGKLAHEHIYWDQASVLVQLGLLDASTLPVVGRDSAQKVRDPGVPSNALIHRAEQGCALRHKPLHAAGNMERAAEVQARTWELGSLRSLRIDILCIGIGETVRVEGSPHVQLRLRPVEFPEKAQGHEWLGIEFDAQIHQREGLLVHDKEGG